ncbi:hypothetical protein K438DRAFT_1946563 [Mycena galopus ATCC 62051]|nr:hypothetical protein K438DRAFT_1946563 [Mycena galopus ATCC 62051]
MMGDVDDRGEDERGDSVVAGALAGTQYYCRGGLALPGCGGERMEARVDGHPFPTVLGDELFNAGAFLDADDRRSSRKYHNGRAALRTTGLRVASARTGWGKDAARTAEIWEEGAEKAQASPTSGRSIRTTRRQLSLGLGGDSMGTTDSGREQAGTPRESLRLSPKFPESPKSPETLRDFLAYICSPLSVWPLLPVALHHSNSQGALGIQMPDRG